MARAATRIQQKDEKRAEIKQAAKEMFARQGFVPTTIRQIAAAVSMEGGSLYYYFRGKDEILASILEDGNRRLLDAVEAFGDGHDPAESLKLLIYEHMRVLAADPEQFMVVTRELHHLKGRHRKRIVGQRDRYEAAIQTLIFAAIDAGKFSPMNVKLTTYGLLGWINSVVFWFDPDGPLSIDEIADEFIGTLFNGLASGNGVRG